MLQEVRNIRQKPKFTDVSRSHFFFHCLIQNTRTSDMINLHIIINSCTNLHTKQGGDRCRFTRILFVNYLNSNGYWPHFV